MVALVGNTGFVGSNIMAQGNVDAAFHSTNIADAYGLKPDVLIYAGLRAEKYLANQEPEKDMETIREAEENIAKIQPKKVVLISTVDVYKNPNGVDEHSEIIKEDLQPYGANRLALEQWVREYDPNALIIRLPGLIGINIKKNFIYDYLNVIPFMLKKEKMEELQIQEPELPEYYELQQNGFYRCKELNQEQKMMLRQKFNALGFSALQFTDSRNVYQFYPLQRLWRDIQTALEQGIRLWNPATEPVSAAEVYQYLEGKEFINKLAGAPVFYDYRTAYANQFGGKDGYIMTREQVLESIGAFVKEMRQ